MQNYKLSLDLSDLANDFSKYDLREYRLPFCLYFVEAENPDEACAMILQRIMNALMRQKNTLDTRILCRKVRRYMRIDRIETVK
jgi:hypothetical protein